MIQNRLGTLYSDQDNPFLASQMEAVLNAYVVRSDLMRTTLEGKKDLNSECDYPDTGQITVPLYREMYDRNPIGARVVEVMAEETWQVSPEVYEDEDPDTETEFEKAFKQLSKTLRGEQSWYEGSEGNPLWEYLKRGDKLSGIGHFGVLLIGIDDRQPLDQPVAGFHDPDESGNGKPRVTYVSNQKREGAKLLYLAVFDENSIGTSGVEYETNQFSPRYRRPKYYHLDLGNSSDTSYAVAGREVRTVKVHWSRVIHLCDNMDSSEVIGTPRMRPIWDRLLDTRKLYGGDAEGFWKNCTMRLFLETHPQLGGDVTVDAESLRDGLYNMENGLQRWMLLRGMAAKTVAPSMVDPTTHINVQIEAICIKLGIPKRIFMGSERGELSSGQDDGSWNDKIRGRRLGYAVPRIIVPFIDRLIQMGVLPEPAKGYQVDWRDPENMKPLEKADLAGKKTAALVQYIGGQGDALVNPLDYLSRFLDVPEDEARGILSRAMETLQEKPAAAAEMQGSIDENFPPPEPPAPPPSGGPPGGGGGKPPPKSPTNAEESELADDELIPDDELSDNAFCPNGPGGGIDPSCPKGGGLKPLTLAKTGNDAGRHLGRGDRVKFRAGFEDAGYTATVTGVIPRVLSRKEEVTYRLQLDGIKGGAGEINRTAASLMRGADEVVENEDATANAFCPTGKGGGIKNTCSSRGSVTTRKGETLVAANRTKKGKWKTEDGQPVPEHVKKFLNPALQEVYVNPDPDGDLLVRGKDAAGRVQSKYSDTHNAQAAASKFGRTAELLEKRKQIYREVDRDARNPELREQAECLKVVMQTGIRPGSARDTGSQYESYGATTIQGRHVVTRPDGSVALVFPTGKNKGREVEFPIRDPQTAAMLQRRAQSAGAEGKLFNTDDSQLRDYSKTKDGGGFKTKDHRTALGTEVATQQIEGLGAAREFSSQAEYKRAVKQVAVAVSQTLGNTPSVALKSYIDPQVFAGWQVKSK